MTRSTWWLGMVLATALLGPWRRPRRAAEAVTVPQSAPPSAGTSAPQPADTGITFQYRPDYQPRVDLTKTTQTMEAQGIVPRTRTNTYREQRTTAASQAGYLVRDTLLEGSTVGEEEADPIITALKGKTITLTVDPAGKIVSMQGWELVSQELLKQLPAGAPESVRKLVSPEFLGGIACREWASNVTDYVGHPAKVGETWVSLEEFPLPDGSVGKCYVAKKVVSASGDIRARGHPRGLRSGAVALLPR